MKSKVVIENGETEIVLTPENEFEKDVLEKLYHKREGYTLHTAADAEYNYGNYKNHKLIVNIKKS